MVKKIKARFIASDDAAFGGGTEDNVYVLTPDLTMSV